MRKGQWEELLAKRVNWGSRGIMEGDFNDIRNANEKLGGRKRSDGSCKCFQNFVERMDMVEIYFQGRSWTWANIWEHEGYIEVRLDRFFGASR